MINSIPKEKIFTAVICKDKPGPEISRIRQETLQAHLEHVEKTIQNIFVAGPIFADDKKTVCGSILIYKTDDQQKARAMLEADPYYMADIWQDISYSIFYGAAGEAVGGIAYK